MKAKRRAVTSSPRVAEQKYPTTVTDVMFIALRDHLTREGKLPRPKKR